MLEQACGDARLRYLCDRASHSKLEGGGSLERTHRAFLGSRPSPNPTVPPPPQPSPHPHPSSAVLFLPPLHPRPPHQNWPPLDSHYLLPSRFRDLPTHAVPPPVPPTRFIGPTSRTDPSVAARVQRPPSSRHWSPRLSFSSASPIVGVARTACAFLDLPTAL